MTSVHEYDQNFRRLMGATFHFTSGVKSSRRHYARLYCRVSGGVVGIALNQPVQRASMTANVSIACCDPFRSFVGTGCRPSPLTARTGPLPAMQICLYFAWGLSKPPRNKMYQDVHNHLGFPLPELIGSLGRTSCSWRSHALCMAMTSPCPKPQWFRGFPWSGCPRL